MYGKSIALSIFSSLRVGLHHGLNCELQGVETGSQAHTAIKRIILSAYFQSLCINYLYSAHTLVTRVKSVDWLFLTYEDGTNRSTLHFPSYCGWPTALFV